MRIYYFPACLLLILAFCSCALLTRSHGTDLFWGRPMVTSKQAGAYSHHIAGIIHERRGELEQAVEAYNAVIRIDNAAIIPRLRLIRAHLRLGEYEQALLVCKSALEQIPKSPELWIAYGELNHHQGNLEEAVEAMKQAIALRPDDLVGYGALVELQEKTNDLVAAIEIYERLIEHSPDSAALHYQLGINLFRIGEYLSAKDSFEQVLALEPRITRARFLLALVLYELSDFESSAEQLRLYLLERQDDAPALEYYAGALFRMGRIKEARSIFERLIAQDDVAPRNYLQFAWVLFVDGEVERAQQMALEGGGYFFADIIFTLSILEGPDEDAWPVNPWDDRYTFDEIESESDLLLSALPMLFDKIKTTKTLTTQFDRLREHIGFSPILEFFSARLLLFSEQYNDALYHLDGLRARGINSKYIHYHSAVVAEKNNNFSDAEFHLCAFLEIDPDNPDALNFLGYLYAFHNRNLDKAEELLLRALATDQDNPYYLDSLGWVYYRQGKGEEAAKTIRRAIYGMDTDDAVLRDHLGDIYLLLGNVEQAVSEWKRAIRLDPAMDEVREKIRLHTPEPE